MSWCRCFVLSTTHAQVIREERRLSRDKAAYQRIKQAYAASGGAAAGRRAAAAAAGGSQAWAATVEVGPGVGGAGAKRSNAAGAVAAAARELRPVELVGIYEGQKEALEKELAAAKAEVRGDTLFKYIMSGSETEQLLGTWASHLNGTQLRCDTGALTQLPCWQRTPS